MKTLLISDLHLSPERPAVTRAFRHFLAQAQGNCDALYILGDLFEAWIGDDDPAPLAQEVIAALRTFSASGAKLFFMCGNRDFAVGKRFARATACELLPDHHRANLYGQSVLLLHGDTLCTEDKQYQQFRRLIRNRSLLAVMTRLPLSLRQRLAIAGRAKSTAMTQVKPQDIMDVSEATVRETFRHHGVNTMIHGHTHRPATHAVQVGGDTATRIVLGDWHQQGWLVEATPQGIELRDFAIPQESENTAPSLLPGLSENEN